MRRPAAPGGARAVLATGAWPACSAWRVLCQSPLRAGAGSPRAGTSSGAVRENRRRASPPAASPPRGVASAGRAWGAGRACGGLPRGPRRSPSVLTFPPEFRKWPVHPRCPEAGGSRALRRCHQLTADCCRGCPGAAAHLPCWTGVSASVHVQGLSKAQDCLAVGRGGPSAGWLQQRSLFGAGAGRGCRPGPTAWGSVPLPALPSASPGAQAASLPGRPLPLAPGRCRFACSVAGRAFEAGRGIDSPSPGDAGGQLAALAHRGRVGLEKAVVRGSVVTCLGDSFGLEGGGSVSFRGSSPGLDPEGRGPQQVW